MISKYIEDELDRREYDRREENWRESPPCTELIKEV
jgi:hypothetical protein